MVIDRYYLKMPEGEMRKSEDGAFVLWTDMQAWFTVTDAKPLRDLYWDLRAIEAKHRHENARPLPFGVGV